MVCPLLSTEIRFFDILTWIFMSRLGSKSSTRKTDCSTPVTMHYRGVPPVNKQCFEYMGTMWAPEYVIWYHWIVFQMLNSGRVQKNMPPKLKNFDQLSINMLDFAWEHLCRCYNRLFHSTHRHIYMSVGSLLHTSGIKCTEIFIVSLLWFAYSLYLLVSW